MKNHDNGKDVLALKTRKIIFETIKEQPGICIRELERTTGFAIGELTYHLPILLRAGLIKEEDDGYYRRFYHFRISERERNIISMLRRDAVKKVIPLFIEYKRINGKLLGEKLPITQSTVAWHINRMKKNNLITEENFNGEKYYKLKDLDAVKKIYLTI